MPVYIPKKSPIEEGLTALTRVAEGVGNAEVEKRRRFETDRDYNFKREQFDESIRQYNETFDFNEDRFTTEFNETKRVNDRTFSESQRQFDAGLVHDKEMQTERIGSQEEIERQQRRVDRERIAAQRYGYDLSYKTDRERIAAQRYGYDLSYKTAEENRAANFKKNKVWVDQLGLLGHDDERLYQQTYTVADGQGNQRQVVWKDTIETMRKAVKAGYAEEMQAVEGAPEGHYKYVPHQMDEALSAIGINPARIIQGDNPDATRYNQAFKNIVAEWDKGNQAKAIQMAGEFQGGGVGLFGGRAERGVTSATAAEGVTTSGAYSPLTDSSINEGLNQRLQLYAGTQYPGGLDAFRSLSVDEQRKQIEALEANRQNLESLNKNLTAEKIQMERDALTFKLEQESLWSDGTLGGLEYQAAQLSGSPFYKDKSGEPQLLLANIPVENRREIQGHYDELIRLASEAQTIRRPKRTAHFVTDQAAEEREAELGYLYLAMATVGGKIDEVVGGGSGMNVARYFTDRVIYGSGANEYNIITDGINSGSISSV